MRAFGFIVRGEPIAAAAPQPPGQQKPFTLNYGAPDSLVPPKNFTVPAVLTGWSARETAGDFEGE